MAFEDRDRSNFSEALRAIAGFAEVEYISENQEAYFEEYEDRVLDISEADVPRTLEEFAAFITSVNDAEDTTPPEDNRTINLAASEGADDLDVDLSALFAEFDSVEATDVTIEVEYDGDSVEYFTEDAEDRGFDDTTNQFSTTLTLDNVAAEFASGDTEEFTFVVGLDGVESNSASFSITIPVGE
ncbi:hypothetical protein [Geomicrobium sp. JCM 19055]|uniref:hypothetical protein n=1 Tax=Geomicrobium sp. JCM 19055 TaxID=1460649 RepID=UPI00045ED713|nr:hypothetical protein [Geomicrobium sp. JCM 19055]GAJ97359.1 hypothetical protein JCM19055_211 [Geomicrobium sp. JCM 19055]